MKNKKIKRLIRLFFAGLFAWPSIVFALIGIFIHNFFKLFFLDSVGKALSHIFYHATAWWMTLFFGSHVHIKGKENLPPKGEAVIYTPNHNSYSDVPLFYKALHRFPSMMAKEELFEIPFVHSLMVSLECIVVKRESLRDSVNALLKGIDYIKHGKSLVIFPEGTRSKTGEVGTFKSGAFKIADKTGCKIVPVVLKNNRSLMENAYNWGIVQIYVEFLPPIDPKELSNEERKNMCSIVENEVKTNFGKYPIWPKEK